MTEEAQNQVIKATKRGSEVPRPFVTPFSEIHSEIISDATSDEKRKELKAEMEKRVREMEENDITTWRDIRAGILKKIKENKWDDVYPELIKYARDKEDEVRGINISLSDREKYNGVVRAAIEMAALDVSTQGMRRRRGDPDFEKWLAAHGKTVDELNEDIRIVNRGKTLDFSGLDLPDLVGESIEEEEEPLKKVIEAIKPQQEMVLIKRAKKEALESQEWKELDEAERELLTYIIEKHFKRSVELVGGNKNIYIRNGSPVDFAALDIEGRVEQFRERLLLKLQKGELSEGEFDLRGKVMLARFEKIIEHTKGTAALINAAGPIMEYFYDGLKGLAATLSTPDYLRYDLTTDELHKMYTALGELPEEMRGPDGEWKLGKEILSKQDQIYAIFRGIAAVHRHKGRNLGRDIVPQHEGKNSGGEKTNFTDYPVTDKQIEFIEKVFAGKGTIQRTINIDGVESDVWIDSPEFVDVISGIFGKDMTIGELRRFFDDSNNEKEIRKVVAGEEVEITEKWLKKGLKKLVGQSIWVYGAEWKVTGDNLEKLRDKLEWRVGSEDKVFVGRDYQVTAGNLSEVGKEIKDDEKVALLRTTPGSIDNIFVMSQDPHTVVETKEKLAVMLNMGLEGNSLWERLKKDDADVNTLVEEFNLAWREYGNKEMDSLDEHIINTARIALLYFCEGANLGWGFEYEYDEKLKITERKVTSGGTKAAADMSTPLFWLQTEASNNWKDWSQGPMPMDKKIARQILDHEPGWAPHIDKNGNWMITYLDKPLNLRIPAKLELSMLNSSKVKAKSGQFESRKALDLVYENVDMSQVPWRRIAGEAPYRWYITINQAARMITLLSKIPDRDTTEAYFGERMTSPRTLQLLELMKREALAHRDAEKMDHVKEFLPFSVAMNFAWQENMLPRSLKPGMFDDGAVNRAIPHIERAIASLAPEGDRGATRDMALSFSRHMGQLEVIGDKISKEVFKEMARGRRIQS